MQNALLLSVQSAVALLPDQDYASALIEAAYRVAEADPTEVNVDTFAALLEASQSHFNFIHPRDNDIEYLINQSEASRTTITRGRPPGG